MMNDEIWEIPVERLLPSASNPRKKFEDGEQFELMESIRSVGVLSYLLVRPVGSNYEIVAGERRFRAARALGHKRIPCRVRELTDEAVGKIQLIENIQRSGLSPVEELAGVRELEELGLKGEVLAKSLGKTAAWVQARLDLGKLPEFAQDAVGRGRVSLASVPDLLEVDQEECAEFVQEVLEIEEPVPVATLRAMVEERYRVPREARERWRRFAEGYETNVALEELDVLEDPGTWAEYVRPYGEGVGKWKLAKEEIGGLAARPEESRLTWGDLAKAHGVKRKLVPVGGVRGGEITAVELVDRSVVESAEKAAKAAGQAFTLGARRVKSGEDHEAPKSAEPVESIEPEAPKVFSGEGDLVTRESAWNPWCLSEAVWYDDEYENRKALVKEVLDSETGFWRENAAAACAESIEGVEEGDLVVWWVLHGLSPEDLRGRRLAVLLGAREFWMERMVGC
jgi:ParB family chromosome partitioning protein